MKYIPTFILCAIILAAGCRTTIDNQNTNKVVVYQLGSMSFPLNGTHGIVIEYDDSTSSPDKLRYELFSAQDNKLISTTDRNVFKNSLSSLPSNTVVDYYDVCMGGLVGRGNRDAQTDVLNHCHTLGISGKFYVMCTCFGQTGNPLTWKWK